MTAFLFCLIAVLLAGIGARDQMTLAAMTNRQGQRPGLLAVALLLTIITAAGAAWLALTVMPILKGDARLLFAAMALVLAGLESLLLSPGRKPLEPTRSLGALAVVLLAHQITDAARFLIFAIAAATAQPWLAGAGGAIGAAIMLGSAWAAPELFEWRRLRPMRRGIGAVLLLAGLFAGLKALGLVG